MNRVTIVNLAGRACNIETAGADALDAWLAVAGERLAADPDRDELLLDFERAIADRCQSAAPGERDVVTAEHVTAILAALGSVEPAVDAEQLDAEAATEQLPRTDVPLRDRKLFRLTGEDEAMLGGVCAGLAAYLYLDVTVIRVAFVVLTLLTSGAMLLVYVAMWLLIPEATTPEQRAQARGAGLTAEEMLSRARDGASPAMAKAGSLIARASIWLLHALRWLVVATILALLAAWATALAWLPLDGGDLLDLFDEGTSTWLVGLWLTCIAWIPVSILLIVERMLAWMVRRGRPARHATASAALLATAFGSFVLACIGTVLIPATSSQELRAISDGHGRIMFGDTEICVNADAQQSPWDDSSRHECDGADVAIQ